MSAGISLPDRVFAHGFLFNKGEKMSKSVGNVVDPFSLIDAYGVDQLRYFLLREVAFGQDGSYSHEAIVNRTNADLANDLGNLAQRSLSMIAKNCGGVLPEPGDFSSSDKAILDQADGMRAATRSAMEMQALNKYLDAVWGVVAEANRYFAARSLGRRRRRTSNGWRQSSTLRRKWCDRSRYWPSRSCRNRRGSCSTCSACTKMSEGLSNWGKAAA